MVAIFIGYLQPESVLARNQGVEGKKLFNRDLAGGGPGNLLHVLGEIENLLVGAVLHHFVLHLAGRQMGPFFRPEVVDLQVDTHLLIVLENVIHARPHLGAADHELARADALGGDLFNQVGQDQGAGGELVGI